MTPPPTKSVFQRFLCGSANGGAMVGDGVIPPSTNQGGVGNLSSSRLDPLPDPLWQVVG